MYLNPFTPNFGQIPMHIAGRDLIMSEIIKSFDDGPGNPARTSILVGARGTGKTALLSYFAEECKSHGWLSVNVACVPGLQDDILNQAIFVGEEYLETKNKRKVKGVSIGNYFSLEWENEDTLKRNWRANITSILDKLNKLGIGLMVTIDEVTPRLDEMIQVASVYQLLLRENKKIGMIMAGLPSEVSALLTNRSISFLRRASQYDLGKIYDYEIEDALLRTIEDSGKKIKREALGKAVEAINIMLMVKY